MPIYLNIDLSGVVAHSPLEITDKLNECRFFLNLMKKNMYWNEFRWLTSAFLNGARSALDWLAYAVYNSRINEDGEFYPDSAALNKLFKYISMEPPTKKGKVFASPIDTLLLKLCEYRQITAHQDSIRISPEKDCNPNEFKFAMDGTGVIDFSENVLSLLEKIQVEVRC